MSRELPTLQDSEPPSPLNSAYPVADRDRESMRRWRMALIVSLFVIAAAHVVDAWAWAHVRDAQVYERDWGRMLRSAGYLPTWLFVAIALWTHDRPRAGWHWRGTLVILTPIATGALAEVIKLLVRRLRPGELSPEYVFRPFSVDPWSNRGMGMPSSHVMVAVGVAVVLARLFPRSWWLWYLLAAGCAYTRVLARAHYVSDVVAAAAFAWLAADVMVRWGLRKRTLAIAHAAVDRTVPLSA
jgi:membrane-associated phospholipid phosphatase